MKLSIFITLWFFSFSSFCSSFVGTFWERKTQCEQFSPDCLPHQVEHPTEFEFNWPTDGNPVEINITGKNYRAQLFISFKEGNPNYYIFQSTIFTLKDKMIAICSRYEGEDTFEEIPVGSCGGAVASSSEENLMAGFSISLARK